MKNRKNIENNPRGKHEYQKFWFCTLFTGQLLSRLDRTWFSGAGSIAEDIPNFWQKP